MTKVLRIDSAGVLREVNVAQTLSTVNFAKEYFILEPSDVIAGYVTLAATPVLSSVTVMLGPTARVEGRDYLVETIGVTTRIVFAGPLAFAGVTSIESGDELAVEYALDPVQDSTEFRKHSIVLTEEDISNQFVDLPELAQDLSVDLIIDCLMMVENREYTLEALPGKTRVHFAGDIGLIGPAALVAGEQVHFQYAVTS